jgi:3-dehydroquinate dehydratase-2
MLGKRDPKIYGRKSLKAIKSQLYAIAQKCDCSLLFFQSNHEGAIIDFLQKEAGKAHGILINLGALTHYGYSLRDALIGAKLPIIEVHLSDINKRESFRKIDVFDGIVIAKIKGLKEKSYLTGLKKLIMFINLKNK